MTEYAFFLFFCLYGMAFIAVTVKYVCGNVVLVQHVHNVIGIIQEIPK